MYVAVDVEGRKEPLISRAVTHRAFRVESAAPGASGVLDIIGAYVGEGNRVDGASAMDGHAG